MKWLLVALGLLMVAAGGYWAFTGSLIVQIERGWSAVIAGSVVFSTGFLILAITALMGAVNRLAAQLRDAQSVSPRPVPAPSHEDTAAVADHPPVAAGHDDNSQLRLELVSSPAPPTPVQHAYMPPAQAADEAKPSPPAKPVAAPKVESLASPTLVDDSAASAMTVDEPAAPTPAPPSPPAAPDVPAPEALAPQGSAPQGSAGQPLAAQSASTSEAPVPAPRPTSEPRKVGWLERALEEASPEELASVKPAASPTPAPEPTSSPPSSPKDAPVKIAEHQAEDEKPAPAPSSAPSVEASAGGAPKAEVVDAQAIAPAVDASKPADPVVNLAPDLKPPPEPARLPVIKPEELEQAPPARRIPEPPPLADLPRIMRKYESQGVRYTLYEDGSIDADSTSGRFRFASLDELRIFLEKKN